MDTLDRASALLRSGQLAEGLRLLGACLADPARPEADRLRSLLLLSATHDLQGALEAAIQAADEALPLARALGDRAAQAEALCLRAGPSYRLGLYRDAAEGIATALTMARAIGDSRVEALALKLSSNQALRHGDEDEACQLLDQSLACARRAGDDEGEFWALNNIANLLGLRAARLAEAGQRDAALPLVAELARVVHEALQVARRTGHWLHHAFAVANLADAYIVEGDHVRSRELVREYAGLARQHGSPRLLAYANLDEVRMLRVEQRPDEAIAVIDCDAHRALLPGSDDIALTTETALYEMHKAAGRFEAALRHHERSSRMSEQRLSRKTEQQLSVLMARMEAEQARAAAERARLDAELSAQRAQVLELEREQMRRVAHEDPLTGTGNRRAADEALRRLLAEPSAGGGPLFVALIDVDHFKAVNDTHGHAAGDAVLATLGRLMRQAVRSRDRVFRYGGEEFLLILGDTSPEAGREACERLRQAIQRHDWSDIAPGLSITASFGLAPGLRGDDADHLVRRADGALYAAKRDGRNRIALAEPA